MWGAGPGQPPRRALYPGGSGGSGGICARAGSRGPLLRGPHWGETPEKRLCCIAPYWSKLILLLLTKPDPLRPDGSFWVSTGKSLENSMFSRLFYPLPALFGEFTGAAPGRPIPDARRSAPVKSGAVFPACASSYFVYYPQASLICRRSARHNHAPHRRGPLHGGGHGARSGHPHRNPVPP